MTERERALARIGEGDIFHAVSESGLPLLCLATRITTDRIDARRLIVQLRLSFDRRTGVGESEDKGISCRINSVASLPPDVHRVMLELDEENNSSHEGKDPRLTRPQKDALLFMDEFYRNHPLS